MPPEQYKRDFAYRTTAAGQVGVGTNAPPPPSAWYIPIFPSFTSFRQCVCTTVVNRMIDDDASLGKFLRNYHVLFYICSTMYLRTDFVQ